MALAGCTGQVFDLGMGRESVGNGNPGAGPGTGTPPVKGTACTGTPTPEIQPLRRLAHEVYRNALIDAFKNPKVSAVVEAQTAGFPNDTESLGFRNNANFSTVRDDLMTRYIDAAEAISAEAVNDLGAMMSCQPTGDGAACAQEFIHSFGRKLFRRALTDGEKSAYLTAYSKARARGGDFKTGIQWSLFALLQSPQFLYQVENDAGAAPGSVRRVTPIELASRLASFVWRSVPDEALLQAAENGQLQSKEDVAREVKRMLADGKARRSIDFYDEWLDADSLPTMTRDEKVFPGLDAKLPALLRQEVNEFVFHVLTQDDAKLSTLLSADYSVVNAALAKHYKADSVNPSGWVKTKLPGERAGLFMLGGVVSNHDKAYRTSIVNRGFKLRTQVMCQVVPAAPANIPQLVTGQLSQRERLAQHRKDKGCASCHVKMDPLGQTFENIDAVGRSRTVDEDGNAVLTDGELTGSADMGGVVKSGKEMMERLAQSNEVKDCFSLQMYRFAFGRQESTALSRLGWRHQRADDLAGADRRLFVPPGGRHAIAGSGLFKKPKFFQILIFNHTRPCHDEKQSIPSTFSVRHSGCGRRASCARVVGRPSGAAKTVGVQLYRQRRPNC
jgi:hypothetical protein